MRSYGLNLRLFRTKCTHNQDAKDVLACETARFCYKRLNDFSADHLRQSSSHCLCFDHHSTHEKRIKRQSNSQVKLKKKSPVNTQLSYYYSVIKESSLFPFWMHGLIMTYITSFLSTLLSQEHFTANARLTNLLLCTHIVL